MNICGVLVHARPELVDTVKGRLLDLPGVEVHAVTDDGRLIVTVEEDEQSLTADTVVEFQNLEGVFSAAMVYQYCDDRC